MAKTSYATVDEFIDALEPQQRKVMQEVRAALNRAVPDGVEVISYSIPAIKHHGWVFYFSIYANHFSLATPPPFVPFEEFEEELAGYKKSKSTVQFPLNEPVPVDLIERMARFQAGLNERKAAEKKAVPTSKK